MSGGKVITHKRSLMSLTVGELMEKANKCEQLKAILDAIDCVTGIDSEIEIDPASWDTLTIAVQKNKRRIERS